MFGNYEAFYVLNYVYTKYFYLSVDEGVDIEVGRSYLFGQLKYRDMYPV